VVNGIAEAMSWMTVILPVWALSLFVTLGLIQIAARYSTVSATQLLLVDIPVPALVMVIPVGFAIAADRLDVFLEPSPSTLALSVAVTVCLGATAFALYRQRLARSSTVYRYRSGDERRRVHL